MAAPVAAPAYATQPSPAIAPPGATQPAPAIAPPGATEAAPAVGTGDPAHAAHAVGTNSLGEAAPTLTAGDPGEGDPAAVPPPTRRRRGLRLTLGVVVISAVATLCLGWATGWRLHVMTTPSMGTAAPVGAVVVSHPARLEALHPGQIIVFHPPGRPKATFAHRITSLQPGPGGIEARTKGDINSSADTWVLHQADLVGQASVVVPDIGFALQALPVGLLCVLILLLVSSGAPVAWRRALRLVGSCIIVWLLIWHYHPLDRAVLISQDLVDHRGTAVVVDTGVLPLRVSAVGGSAMSISPGHVAVVHLDRSDLAAFTVATTTHLHGWWWLILLLALVPILIGLAFDRTELAA